jgi:hypothetical protein
VFDGITAPIRKGEKHMSTLQQLMICRREKRLYISEIKKLQCGDCDDLWAVVFYYNKAEKRILRNISHRRNVAIIREKIRPFPRTVLE